MLALAVGLALRVGQFLARPSLWVDEAAVARNILDRDLAGLLSSPLDYGQVAPPGFLLLVELCSRLFGGGEYSLRLVPLIAGSVSLFVFHALARRHLSPPGTAVALLLFAATPLVLFSSNLKPYAYEA